MIKRKSCGHLRCGSVCRFGTKQKKVYRIPKVSAKRKLENEEYFAKREIFLLEHPKCECGRPGCNRMATEVHHSAGRVGKNFLDVSTWKAMSRLCHRWAELNPDAAKAAGVSASRLSKTET